MMSEDLKSIQILGCGLKCQVHRSSVPDEEEYGATGK